MNTQISFSKLKTSLLCFVRKEIVLCISAVLAIVSCFLVPVSKKYIEYIDFRVLALLFCLMLIVAGFRSVGFFQVLAHALFRLTHTIRSTAMVFVLLCFFGSMLITNDVSLILFVPLSIFMMGGIIEHRHLIFLVVFETIAANLGSMFTPIGNPQNLYIFTFYKMQTAQFFETMLPYTAVSLALLLGCMFLFPKAEINEDMEIKSHVSNGTDEVSAKMGKSRIVFYICFTALFVLILATVIRVVPFWITLLACIVVALFLNAKLFGQVDYCLLLTFVALFIFVGNMGELTLIKNTISDIVAGHEVATSIILSQVISNVPATLLLSHFTRDSIGLLIGVNLGGLGTMIASMASLISYKFYAKEKESKILSYFLWFSLFNIVFLIILICLSLVFS